MVNKPNFTVVNYEESEELFWNNWQQHNFFLWELWNTTSHIIKEMQKLWKNYKMHRKQSLKNNMYLEDKLKQESKNDLKI